MALNESPDAIKHNVNPVVSRLGILLLIAFCLVFISSYTNRLVEKSNIDQENLIWDQRIAEAEDQQLKLLKELEYVRSDAYVEERARTDLDMAKPGDTVLMVTGSAYFTPETDEAEQSQPAQESHTTTQNRPIWLQWVSAFVGED